MKLIRTHGIDMDSRYRHGLMVQILTHGKDMHSWYRHGLMAQTWTHGNDKTHGIDSDSWYNIGPPESDTYKRAECCLQAEFDF